MKLSENTLNILKNFASINSSLLVKSGNTQKTLNIDETVLAEAVITEDIPKSFGIYDLPQFLANVTTLDQPTLTLNDNSLVMDDGNIKLNYFYCSPSLITAPPEKGLKMDNPDVQFNLAQTSYQKLIRIAALNNLPTLTVTGKNGELSLNSHEKSNSNSNSASVKLGEYTGKDFEASFKIETLKMIPDDYTVSINLAGFALFENKSQTLRYFIALEKK